MKIYIFDGSFDGLLTSIYEAYYRKEIPNKITSSESFQEDFLSERVHIFTDLEKANKVYQSIKSKISPTALKNVFYAYLSEQEDIGTWVYDYLKLGWQVGKHIDLMLSDDRVLNIHKLRQKVTREIHLLLGLIRFRQLEGNIYYGPIAPQYNVVPLLASHFSRRLSEENWIIHDVDRGLAVVYNKKDWIVRDLASSENLPLSHEEKNYQELWKAYYKSIAIQTRINPRLQKRNMPMKYWRYLIEKDEN